MPWVYDKRKAGGTWYWHDPQKNAEARERYNQKRREKRAATRKPRTTLTRDERREQNLAALPTLLDECEICGDEDVKLYRYTPTGQFHPTSLRGEVYYGYSWARITEIVKSNRVLCKLCKKEIHADATTNTQGNL